MATDGEASGRAVAGGRGEGTPDGVPPDVGSPASDTARRAAPGTTLRRLFWFGALWLAGVATVFALAWLIRAVLMP